MLGWIYESLSSFLWNETVAKQAKFCHLPIFINQIQVASVHLSDVQIRIRIQIQTLTIVLGWKEWIYTLGALVSEYGKLKHGKGPQQG